MTDRNSILRSVLVVLCVLGLVSFLAPAAFAGCGEICNFMDCESSSQPEEGCIERPQFCLDMLCYSTTPAACAIESAQAESRVDTALEGVDATNPTALVEALATLDFPIRVVVRGEVLYQTPNFEVLKERQQAIRRGEVLQSVAPEVAPQD